MAYSHTSLALLFIACAIGGCTVGDDYRPPDPPHETTFVNAALVAKRSAAIRDADDHWWAAFGDAKLVELVDLALAQNLDLGQAEARVDQARAAARAAGAALLPSGQTSAQGAAIRQSLESPLGRIGNAFPNFNRNQRLYDVGFAASWEVDLFGGLRRNQQAARAQYEATEAAARAVQLSVAAATADAYVLVRTLQARLEVARTQVERQRRLVAIVSLQFDRGLVPRLQRDQAQGALFGVEANIPVLKAALEAQLDAIDVLVGLMPGTLHDALAFETAIPRAPGISADGGASLLVRRRPDLIAAERTLAASDARVGAAVADYYPRVSLSGLLGFESRGLPNLLSGSTFQPQALAGIRWRLFDFGRVDAEVAAARGARAEALAAYRQSVLKATSDVEVALTGLVRREEQKRLLDEGEASLSRARVAAQASYDAGGISLIEVLDADDRLLAVRDQRVIAQSEVSRAAIACFKALGGGWDRSYRSNAIQHGAGISPPV